MTQNRKWKTRKKRRKKANLSQVTSQTCDIFNRAKAGKDRFNRGRCWPNWNSNIPPFSLQNKENSLCYCCFQGKTWTFSRKKTTTCVCLTDFEENVTELENMCKVFRERFRDTPLHLRKPEKGLKAMNKKKSWEIFK